MNEMVGWHDVVRVSFSLAFDASLKVQYQTRMKTTTERNAENRA